MQTVYSLKPIADLVPSFAEWQAAGKIPSNYIVFNAPRPMFGFVLNGQCLTGVFYGFVDAGNQTQIDLSLEHGGRAVVTVTEDDVREWVRTVRGLDPAEFEFSALWAAFVQGHKVA